MWHMFLIKLQGLIFRAEVIWSALEIYENGQIPPLLQCFKMSISSLCTMVYLLLHNKTVLPQAIRLQFSQNTNQQIAPLLPGQDVFTFAHKLPSLQWL